MPIKHGEEWLYFEKEVADLVEQGKKNGIEQGRNDERERIRNKLMKVYGADWLLRLDELKKELRLDELKKELGNEK